MNNEDIIIIKKRDNGSEISIKCGDVIQIELEGIGSAGYKWHVDNLEEEHLELLTEETVAMKEGVTGAPVLEIRRFKAIKNGNTEIRMSYYREWEGTEKAADNFLIKLNIQ